MPVDMLEQARPSRRDPSARGRLSGLILTLVVLWPMLQTSGFSLKPLFDADNLKVIGGFLAQFLPPETSGEFLTYLGQATLVASLHAVDLALANFARIVGVRDGRLAFDLPAAQVSDAQLQALYAHADGSPADLPTLHKRQAPVAPAGTAAPAPIQVNACR